MRKRRPSPVKGKPRFCLGEGSYPSSLGVPFTTLTVTGLLLHRPPAHQTSYLSQCPDRHSPARSFAKTPCEHLPLSGRGLMPPGQPAPDPPCAVCLGHLLPCFCLQQPVLGERGSGYWGLREPRGRAWCGGGSRGPEGTAPGEGQRRVLDRGAFWVLEGALFQEPNL